MADMPTPDPPDPRAPALVALYRVSTDGQGQSGLGLAAQEEAVERHRASAGARIIAAYTEVESGTHSDLERRPQLLRAIAHARRSRATLCIAKLDRLARNPAVVAHLKKAGVRFVACDNPFANELTIDILVAVAADEARRIATRTKEALAAYRREGRVSRRVRALHPGGVPAEVVAETAGKLGAELPQCRNLTQEARERGARAAAQARSERAGEAYGDIAPWMIELRAQGLSQAAIAARLNAEGHTTRTGRPWGQVQVGRVLRRAGPHGGPSAADDGPGDPAGRA